MQRIVAREAREVSEARRAAVRDSVCISADDYGISAGTNAAIESLVDAGRIDAVSVMSHRDASLTTIRALRDAHIPIGLHLCFTGVRPLGGGDALAKTYRGLFARLATSRGLARAIEHEADAQVDRLTSAGVTIAFLNGHEHVHLHPLLWPIVVRLAERLRVRAVRTAVGQALDFTAAGLLAASSRLAWRRAPLRGVEVLSPLGVGRAGAFSLEAIDRQLARPLYGGTRELCMHPSFDDPGRRAEHTLLASGKLAAHLAERGFVRRSP